METPLQTPTTQDKGVEGFEKAEEQSNAFNAINLIIHGRTLPLNSPNCLNAVRITKPETARLRCSTPVTASTAKFTATWPITANVPLP
ncbi:hypothetical protein TNCV_4239781 [Trichonephila clavipes]|nr:hypothetical protein TNCV_4239781 [Trichonephila clavipes]